MNHKQDRRSKRRFPLCLDLDWRSLNSRQEGQGQTVNMSSTGILLTAAHKFGIGERVELWICWPVKLEREHPLQLVALAEVVRCEKDRVAVEIHRREFRLEGAADLTPRKGAVSADIQLWASLKKDGGSS